MSFSGSVTTTSLKTTMWYSGVLAGVVSGADGGCCPNAPLCTPRNSTAATTQRGKIPRRRGHGAERTRTARSVRTRPGMWSRTFATGAGPFTEPIVCASPPRPSKSSIPMLGRRFVRAAGNGSFSRFEPHARVRPITKGLRGRRATAAQRKGSLANRIGGTIPVDERRRVAVD